MRPALRTSLILAGAAVVVAILGGRQLAAIQETAAAETLVGRWIDRTPTGQSAAGMPKGAEDCAMIYDPVLDRVIVAGGKDDGDFNRNETWAFDVGEHVWTPLKTSAAKPPTSEDHSAIFDPIGYRVILYGGENGQTTNKLWTLDLKTLTWRDVTNAGVPRRESHSAVYDSRGKRMIVFGGMDRNAIDLYDVWGLDLDPESSTFEKWQNLTVAEGRPPGRIDHSSVYDPGKNRLVFNGGWTKGRKALFGDTWAFYFAGAPDRKGRWSKVDTGTRMPPERRHGAAAYDSKRNLYIVFGGSGSAGFLNDTWAFDLTRDVWKRVITGEAGPKPRIDHAAVYDSRRGSVLMYGGDSGVHKGKLHEIWELTLEPASTTDSGRPD
jgi:Galactose oxidase, central domain